MCSAELNLILPPLSRAYLLRFSLGKLNSPLPDTQTYAHIPAGYCPVNPSFAFPISAQPQAVYSNLIKKIRLNMARKYRKQSKITARDVTFTQQQNFNAVLAVKQRGRETEEKQGKVL